MGQTVDTNLEAIALACVRECYHRHVGLDRLAGLLAGYAYAAGHADRLPSEGDAVHLAGLIEVSSLGRYRRASATVPTGGSAVAPDMVAAATARLFASLGDENDPGAFIQAFLSIHPFSDGNERTAFVLYNWLRQSLAEPVSLPDYPPT